MTKTAGRTDGDQPRKAAPEETVPRRSPLAGRGTTVVSVLSVIVVLAVWELLAALDAINTATMSSPSDILSAARRLIESGELLSAIGSSAKLFGLGLGISALIGIPGGIVLGWWRMLGAVFEPFIAILYATPLIAILPLILVWFGITFKAQVVMVVLVSVFPMLVSVTAGVRQVDPALLRLARSYRASQTAILRTLVLPSTVPFIITGLRLSMGLGLVGVVVAEYFLGEKGLGGLILRAGLVLDTSTVFVGIVVLGASSLLLTGLIKWIDRTASAWR